MDATNLGTVFGPSVMWSGNDTAMVKDYAKCAMVVTTLIEHIDLVRGITTQPARSLLILPNQQPKTNVEKVMGGAGTNGKGGEGQSRSPTAVTMERQSLVSRRTRACTVGVPAPGGPSSPLDTLKNMARPLPPLRPFGQQQQQPPNAQTAKKSIMQNRHVT